MQQINLYQPIFRKEKKVFSAVAMLQVTVLVTLILAAVYGYSWWQLQPFQDEIDRMTAERQRLMRQIDTLKAEVQANSKSQLLEDELKRVRNELSQKREIKAVLDEGRFGNKRGFSSMWEGLARQHVTGLWLTGVRIEEGGRKLFLKGKTISAELVPIYIQKLSAEEAFSETSFNVLQLSRDKNDPSVIQFNLGTSRDNGRHG